MVGPGVSLTEAANSNMSRPERVEEYPKKGRRSVWVGDHSLCQPKVMCNSVTSVFIFPLLTGCCFIKMKLELTSIIRRKLVCFCCRIQKMFPFLLCLKVQLKYRQSSGASYVFWGFFLAIPVQPHFFVISLTLVLSFLPACSPPQEQNYKKDIFVSFMFAWFEYPPNTKFLNMNIQSLNISWLGDAPVIIVILLLLLKIKYHAN